MKTLPIYATILIDILIMSVTFSVANILRFHQLHVVASNTNYMDMFLLILVAYIVTTFFFKINDDILGRGKLGELMALLKQYIYIGFTVLLYLYLFKSGHYYSRIQLGYFFLFSYVAMFFAHTIIKAYYLKLYCSGERSVKMILVTNSARAQDVISKVKKSNNWYFHIYYIAIMDKDLVGASIDGIPVVANADNFYEVVHNLPLDAAFINVDQKYDGLTPRMTELFDEMGVTVHVNIRDYEYPYRKKNFDHIGKYGVVTFSNYQYDIFQEVIKRVMDIVAGFVGVLITAVLFIFVAPAIYIDDPGPIFFSQVRIGKNGRRFHIYKFRSMCMNAESMKAELMEQNEADGGIFKMKDDPRVTRVGRFLRRTSIDEFPQFFNILKGDMSLVGTRPPTEDEFAEYEAYQRRRISIKPGLTGMWQANGRSEVTSFEEIVEMDCDYIDNWSIWLDIKLILKTIKVVLFQQGAE
jgi:exopolysaccharide biosynthesis polyprenyl glycosylphosphotransferase